MASNSDVSSEEESLPSSSILCQPSLNVVGNINVHMHDNSVTYIGNNVDISGRYVRIVSKLSRDDIDNAFEELKTFWKRRHSLKQRKIDPNIWPNVQYDLQTIFTDLELNDREVQREERIKLEDLFVTEDSNRAQKIFVEGNPGFGKTTLSHKLYEDWVQDADYMRQFHLVFLVQLRHISKENFREYFNHALIPQEKRGHGDTYWTAVTEFQEQTLFILDGYDEVTDKLKSEIGQLMEGSLFGQATVVLTSRILPTNARLISYCSKHVIVKGFGRDQITYFASKMLPGSMADEFYENLSNFDVCWELAKCPLTCIMLCQLFKDKNGALPKSSTQLYVHMIRMQIRRAAKRNKSSTYMAEDDEDDYSDEDDEGGAVFGHYDVLLQRLGELCLECLLKDEFSFKRAKLKKWFGQEYSKLIDLAILHKENDLDSQKESTSVTYVLFHRTFQELFAAFYLGNYVESPEQLACLLRQVMESHIDSYYQIVPFMVGLLGQKASVVFDVYNVSRIDTNLANLIMPEILPDSSSVLDGLAERLNHVWSWRTNDHLGNSVGVLALRKTSAVKLANIVPNSDTVIEDISLQKFLGGNFPPHVPITTIAVEHDSPYSVGQLRFQSRKLNLANLKLGFSLLDDPSLADAFYENDFKWVVKLLTRHVNIGSLEGLTFSDEVVKDRDDFTTSLAALCESDSGPESLELNLKGTWEILENMWDFLTLGLSTSTRLKKLVVMVDGFSGGCVGQFSSLIRLWCTLLDLSHSTNLRSLIWNNIYGLEPDLLSNKIHETGWARLTHVSLHINGKIGEHNCVPFFESFASSQLESLELNSWKIYINNSVLIKLSFVNCQMLIVYPSVLENSDMDHFQFPTEGSVLPKLTTLQFDRTIFTAVPANYTETVPDGGQFFLSKPYDASLRTLHYFRSQIKSLRLDSSILSMGFGNDTRLYWFAFIQRLPDFSRLTSLQLEMEWAMNFDVFTNDAYLREHVPSAYATEMVSSQYLSEALRATNITDICITVETTSIKDESQPQLIWIVEEILRGLPHVQRLGIPSTNFVSTGRIIAGLLRQYWKGEELFLNIDLGLFGSGTSFIHILIHDLQFGNKNDIENFDVQYCCNMERDTRDKSFHILRKSDSAINV